jgi:hypothetical protein
VETGSSDETFASVFETDDLRLTWDSGGGDHVFEVVGLFEPVFDHEVEIVALVEDLALDVGVISLEQLHLLVLLRDQFLVHRRYLDEELVLGHVEVRGEELDRLAVFESDREAARLVLPWNAVEVEEEGELPLAVVSEIDLVRRQGFGIQGATTSMTPGSSSSSGNNW